MPAESCARRYGASAISRCRSLDSGLLTKNESIRRGSLRSGVRYRRTNENQGQSRSESKFGMIARSALDSGICADRSRMNSNPTPIFSQLQTNAQRSAAALCPQLPSQTRSQMRRAAFLDRDGVINIDRGFVIRVDEFEFVPDVLAAARAIAERDFALVVVTNQSGIGRGLYSEEEFLALTQ